jgi:hypothetical protein
MTASVAYTVLGTVHNETLTGHRITVSLKRGGRAVVNVYRSDGERVHVFVYRRLERVQIDYEGL